jgi:ribosomal protein L37E
MTKNDYTFREQCDVCGSQPVLKDTGMCAVCSFGESDSLWDWIYDRWEGKELKLAQNYLKGMQKELSAAGMSFAPDISRRVLHLLSLKEKS